jgi:predicted acylesterase/phospholipase RssA
MNSAPGNEKPRFPKPPDDEIRRVLRVIAMILSGAESGRDDRRLITRDALVGRLKELRHTTAVIEWAIHVGLARKYLDETTVSALVQRQLSSCTFEAKATTVDTPAIVANDAFWNAWRQGTLNEATPDATYEEGVIADPVAGGEDDSLAHAGPTRTQTSVDGKHGDRRFVLALSGGGLRATLFHLGVITHLQQTHRLRRVSGVVSVSGGSILAAHFVSKWTTAVRSSEGFISVAADLIKFARSDIRNSVVAKWMWSWLLPWKWLKWKWLLKSGLTSGLESAYKRHFGEVLLGDMAGQDYPRIAIVASDSIRQERVVFCADEIMRFPVNPVRRDRMEHPVAILGNGMQLARAVTASSCFPPVFHRMMLDHVGLGLRYEEFKEVLSLNDGGVAGNLGVEALLELVAVDGILGDIVLVSDAERPQYAKPRDSLFADSDLQAAALSSSARDRAARDLGKKGVMVRLSERVPEALGLPFVLQTRIGGYRTDLDKPSWQEVHALVLHGASVAAYSLDSSESSDSMKETKTLIAKAIHEAGGPKELARLTELDLKYSHLRWYGKLIVHLSLIIAVACFLLGVLTRCFRWL